MSCIPLLLSDVLFWSYSVLSGACATSCVCWFFSFLEKEQLLAYSYFLSDLCQPTITTWLCRFNPLDPGAWDSARSQGVWLEVWWIVSVSENIWWCICFSNKGHIYLLQAGHHRSGETSFQASCQAHHPLSMARGAISTVPWKVLCQIFVLQRKMSSLQYINHESPYHQPWEPR